MSKISKVVIVGAGFAGMRAARALGNDSLCDVTVIDRRNYHLFQPLLYQVAMAGLSPAEIATPIRSELSRYKNIRVVMANVTNINLDQKFVTTEYGDTEFDYLILACGANHSYFGKNEWEPFAPGLKTLEQATEIRRRVLLAFELAEVEKDPVKKRQHLSFVVIGGGPTGVELAGSLGEISRFTLAKDFRNIDPRQTRIILVEANKRILAQFPEKSAQRAARDLESLGVTIWTESRVSSIDKEFVQIGQEKVMSSTILWAAGVKPSSLNDGMDLKKDHLGRIIIGPDLSLEKHDSVFVLGDQAAFKEDSGEWLPGLAPVAIQQGSWAAKNIKASILGKPREPFKYFDKGIMATIGRKRAVVNVGKAGFSGTLAWFMWLFVHIYYLIGFHNKIFVMMQWLWSYFRFRKGARLISKASWRSFPN